MAAARKRASAAARKSTATNESAPADEALTEEQKTVASATSGTSKTEAGGVERVKESAIRMESEGVMTQIKSDFDNPESPVVGDPAGALVGPKDPGKVTVGPGETAAQHEAHVLLNHPQRIAERIEKESGPDGLPTDVIARQQQDEVARIEFQRLDGNIGVEGGGDPDAIQPGLNDGSKKAGIPPK